jgi:hypothetical protein
LSHTKSIHNYNCGLNGGLAILFCIISWLGSDRRIWRPADESPLLLPIGRGQHVVLPQCAAYTELACVGRGLWSTQWELQSLQLLVNQKKRQGSWISTGKVVFLSVWREFDVCSLCRRMLWSFYRGCKLPLEWTVRHWARSGLSLLTGHKPLHFAGLNQTTPPCGTVFHKGRFLVPCCSCYTLQTSAPSPRYTVCLCPRMPTTLGCTPAVPPSTHPHPLLDCCAELRTLIAGCRRTASSWMARKPSSSGWDLHNNWRWSAASDWRSEELMPPRWTACETWASHSTGNWWWSGTLILSRATVSTTWVSYALCAARWHSMLCAPLSRPSSSVGSTTAMLFCAESLPTSFGVLRRCFTLPLGSSQTSIGMAISRRLSATRCTGCRSHSALITRSLWWLSTASEALVLPISGTFVNQCRLSPEVRICDLRIAAISSYRERWGSATELAVSVLLHPLSGTAYLCTFTPEISAADNSREYWRRFYLAAANHQRIIQKHSCLVGAYKWTAN